MGITSHLDSYPAEGLGGLRIGVSPLEMAQRLRDDRVRRLPQPRRRRSRRSSCPTARSTRSTGSRIARRSSPTARRCEAIKAMEANAQRGTGTASQFGCSSVAGKTGTTTSFTDAWFDGMVPRAHDGGLGRLSEDDRVDVLGATASRSSAARSRPRSGTTSCRRSSRSATRGPTPKEPFVAQPFFGRYSSTGAPGGGDRHRHRTSRRRPARRRARDQRRHRDTQGTGGQKYPPDQYASPPQPAPQTQDAARAGRHARDRAGRRRRPARLGRRGSWDRDPATVRPYGEGRKGRVRGRGRRGPAQRDVPRQARQRPRGARARGGQDAALPHPHPSRATASGSRSRPTT